MKITLKELKRVYNKIPYGKRNQISVIAKCTSVYVHYVLTGKRGCDSPKAIAIVRAIQKLSKSRTKVKK